MNFEMFSFTIFIAKSNRTNIDVQIKISYNSTIARQVQTSNFEERPLLVKSRNFIDEYKYKVKSLTFIIIFPNDSMLMRIHDIIFLSEKLLAKN